MPVPTLPGTHWPAPKGFFTFLDFGGEILADIIIVITLLFATSYPIWQLYIALKRFCNKKRGERLLFNLKHESRPKQFLIVTSRKINVWMFPDLFKELWHSSRNSTRRFILFLDRRVENNSAMLFCFSLCTLAIVSAALLVIFRYIPVTIIFECLEKDDQLRKVFCFTNNSTWPVDCGAYNATELEEIEFVCYAISIFDFGIALAAAQALAKLAAMVITIYIRVTTFAYEWSRRKLKPTKNHEQPGKDMSNCHNYHAFSKVQNNTQGRCERILYRDLCNARILYRLYRVAAVFVLVLTVVLSYSAITVIIKSRMEATMKHTEIRRYLAYAALPSLLFCSLLYITCNLGRHCNQQSYSSYCKLQEPALLKHREVWDEATAKVDMRTGEVDFENLASNKCANTCVCKMCTYTRYISYYEEQLPANVDKDDCM